ncbi:heparinase II/III family protein [Candidatus Venteria ishoeyi]|uniref:Heparin-sulfate lyase n=1 Tax=Candidatus Venteria ishoeyi TaxID=1899563 RepID=A0A1H6FBB0_9GAMM|nr:heparinase II/III family protein [Candidatus Venteria ishoeyi]SEH06304.1 Heparin-sulfate lyase precursor [Candidatus Venteria ishoeyi]
MKITSILIIFFLTYSIVSAKTITNKEWFKEENLLQSITFYINGKSLDLDVNTKEIMKYYQDKPFDYYFMPKNKKVSDNKKKCAINIKKNIYTLRPKIDVPVTLPSNLSWSEDPFKDRNWRFWFHSWKFTDCLLSGYTEFQEQWYLKRLKWLVSDWWKDNFRPEFPAKEFSWHDHSTAKRLHEMLKIFEFVRREKALDQKFIRDALRSIFWHAQILSAEDIYIKNNNHGLDQSVSLFEVSQLFREFEYSEIWEKKSRERLENEISFALTTEGIHTENSPSYHGWVSAKCATINKFAKHYTDLAIVDNNILQDNGLRFLSVIAKPDRTLPLIGDTSNNLIAKATYPDLKKLSWYPFYQYVISQGKNGVKPKEIISFFPESGYYIYRDKWDEPGENTALHFIMKCGYNASGHRHNDDGTILLYGLGENWLIDSGIYGYRYDKYRNYITSPSAHNISFPYEYKDSTPTDKSKINSFDDRLKKYKNNWGFKQKEPLCESHMYKGYTYIRKLNTKGNVIFLSDSLLLDNSKANKSKKFITTFRVPLNKRVYINKNKKIIFVLNQSGSAALRIYYKKDFYNIKVFSGKGGEITSLETVGWLELKPSKTISFIDKSVNYRAEFELLVTKEIPSLLDFVLMD